MQKTKAVGRQSGRKLPAKKSRSAKDHIKNRKGIKCEVMFGAT
jgi:hypothetical protein